MTGSAPPGRLTRPVALTPGAGLIAAPRRLDRITAPVTVTVGALETPERQASDFARALEAAGNPVAPICGESCFHPHRMDSLCAPYAVNRAAPAPMGLGAP